MIRRPPRSTLFPYTSSSDLDVTLGGRRLGERQRPVDHRSELALPGPPEDRKSTRLNSSHTVISYAVFCLKKKKKKIRNHTEIKKKNADTTERWYATNTATK